MLTKVEARNPQGALLSLPLEDETSGLLVLDIGGLDPVKATLSSSATAKQAGGDFQSAHREPRNITMKLGLQPDYVDTSVADLRDRLYDYFMPQTTVYLRFYDGSRVVDITGWVESFEAPLFVQDPEADISIMCYKPDFIETTSETFGGNTTSDTTESLLEYTGNISVGFEFVLNVDRTMSEFTIYVRPPDGSLLTMDYSGEDLIAGDVVTIRTVQGNNEASLLRAGTLSSVLYAIDTQATWAELQKGDNHIRIYATGAAVPYTITYTNRYGGL